MRWAVGRRVDGRGRVGAGDAKLWAVLLRWWQALRLGWALRQANWFLQRYLKGQGLEAGGDL